MPDRRVLADLARQQHGLVTRKQARSAGFSPGQIRTRIARGSWKAIEREVYLLASHPSTWRTSVLAAVLRTEGVASHRTAGGLWDLDGIRVVRPEVTVPHARKVGSRTATVHRTTQWNRIEATVRSSIAVTGVARTLLDMAWWLSQTQLVIAVDSARLRNLVDWPDLYTVYRRHSRQGRTSCGPFRLMLDQHLGEETMSRSGWGRLVQKMLVDAGLPKPALEYPVRGPNRFAADLDLAYPDQHLGIELDSASWHLNRTSFENDPRRRNKVQNLGWSVLNFTWADYIERGHELIATVRTALEQRS
jgi:hypothetical protein